VEEVKDAINSAAAGGSAARRIAGEAGREYVLHRDGGEEQGVQPAVQRQQERQQGAGLQAPPALPAGGAAAVEPAAAAPPPAVQPATQHASALDAGEGGAVLDIEFDVAAGEDFSDASELHGAA
jgi:hypothetical protein